MYILCSQKNIYIENGTTELTQQDPDTDTNTRQTLSTNISLQEHQSQETRQHGIEADTNDASKMTEFVCRVEYRAGNESERQTSVDAGSASIKTLNSLLLIAGPILRSVSAPLRLADF